MSDYINRDAFVRDKRKQYCSDCNKRKGYRNGKVKICYEIGDAPCRFCGIGDMFDIVEYYPAADVRENVRGAWQNNVAFHITCSECGCTISANKGVVFFTHDSKYKFCPNCGADMRGDKCE